MAKKFDLLSIDLRNLEIPAAAAQPLYAGVGATDYAVEKVRAKVAEVRDDLTEQVRSVQSSVKNFELPQPKTLQAKAADSVTTRRAKVEAKVAELQADALALPSKVQTEVKSRYDENVATVADTYTQFAKRGQGIVSRIRAGEGGVEVTVKATSPVTDVTSAPADFTTVKKAPAAKAPAKKASSAQATAKKAPAKKAAAKKAPAKKTSAAKAPAKKTATKKTTTTKASGSTATS